MALKAASFDTVKGKIVFINHKMKVSRDYGSVVQARSRGASLAAERGAVGIVIRSVGTDSHRFPHTGMMRYQDGIAKIPAAAMSNSDADLVANMLKRGKAVSLKLKLSSSTEEQYTSYNVIAEITGSQLPDEYVLIGGHLDSWDLATGALDDGAGCAITMAAAVAIKQAGLKPKRSIRVVLFANEEQGLYGGNAYLAAHQHEIHKIQAGSEADAGQGPVMRLSSYVRPEALPVVQQMQQVLAPIGVAAGDNHSGSGPDMGGLTDAGMASFDLTLKADDYFDYHHTPDDTFDKIEASRFNQSVAAYATFTYMAAQSPVNFGSGPGLAKKK